MVTVAIWKLALAFIGLALAGYLCGYGDKTIRDEEED